MPIVTESPVVYTIMSFGPETKHAPGLGAAVAVVVLSTLACAPDGTAAAQVR